MHNNAITQAWPQILSFLYEIGPGDTYILNASCIFSNRGYPANAFCMVKTEVLFLPSAIFKKLLNTYPDTRPPPASLLHNPDRRIIV